MTDLLVIGGGAAGLMAAGAACAKGLTVTVLEHNPKGPGQKLLITGKGRCNVTSDSDVREFLPYVRHNGRFLYSSLYAFPPASAMQLFVELGVPLKTERGNRVFPVSDRAFDVSAALERRLKALKVQVLRDRAPTGARHCGQRTPSSPPAASATRPPAATVAATSWRGRRDIPS